MGSLLHVIFFATKKKQYKKAWKSETFFIAHQIKLCCDTTPACFDPIDCIQCIPYVKIRIRSLFVTIELLSLWSKNCFWVAHISYVLKKSFENRKNRSFLEFISLELHTQNNKINYYLSLQPLAAGKKINRTAPV